MPQLQSQKRTAAGLVTNPNALSETPEGALLEAENCVVDRPGVIGSRRGFDRYGTVMSAASFVEYQRKLLAHDATGSKLYYDPDAMGNWVAYSGSFAAPDSAVKVRGIESQGTLYLTSSAGVRKTDLVTVSPSAAGIPAGLDLKLSLTGTGAGWFTPETAVAYRILWGRVDRTDRLLQGAPSFRETLLNPRSDTLSWTRSGTTATVTNHIAHGFTTGDIITISASSDTAAITNGAKTITVTGADSYTFTCLNAGATSGTLKDEKLWDVRVEFTIPDDVEEGDFYEIYRTNLSASLATEPGDTQLRVIRYSIPATSVALSYAAGVVTVSHTAHGFATGDVVKIFTASDPLFEEGRHLITVTGANAYTYTVAGAPPATGTSKVFRMHVVVTDDWDLSLGDKLYTNIDQEGILKANTRPPWAKDAALYKGYMHYLNTKKEHFLEIQLIDVVGLVDGTSSLTVTQGATVKTYTFATAESVANRNFQRVTTELTLAQNIEKTMKSLTRIINRDPGSLWYAYYVSGITDPPGAVVIEARTLNTTGFSIICNNATTAGKFTPTLPTSGTTFFSDNQEGVNRLYQSKVDQPEAVPDLDWDPIGDESREGLRIMSLRDSLMIVTRGGIYRKSGKGDRGFTMDALDLTVQACAPETWVTLDSAIYGLSQNGIVRVTEAGTQLISWPIDDIISELLTFPNFETISHAVGFESESKYILWCQEKSTDTKATIAWVYNTITRAWSGPWRKPVKAAHVLFDQVRLYVAHDDTTFPFVLKERNTGATDLSDYIDEEMGVNIGSVGTALDEDGATVSEVTVTGYAFTQIPVPGWLFRKDPSALPFSKIRAVSNPVAGTYILTLEDYFPGLTAGTGKVAVGYKRRAAWVPEAVGNPGSMKHFSSVQIYLEKGTAIHNNIGFSSDIDPTETFPGEIEFNPEVGGVMIREIVPQEFQRCRALNLVYELRYAKETMNILHVSYDVRVTSDITMARSK